MDSPRRILTERGLSPHKGRGQNFLCEPGLARAMVKRAGIGPGDPVLEIGPGLGALTRLLLEAGAVVTAVEIDQGLHDYLAEELLPLFPDRLTLVRADVLEVDLAAVMPGNPPRFKVVANLPYVISTPLLLKLLDYRTQVSRAVLMFQKELAERLTAVPGTKDYGRLTVLLGYYALVTPLMEAPARAFYPRPQVGSTVLEVVFKPGPKPELKSEALFRRVLAAAFSRRRKTLRNSLASAFPKDQVEAALAAAGIDPGRRAETLGFEEFAALANSWASNMDEPPLPGP
ncbi:MAG: 16S rRNA (adenine(1518)-N(6)/adenine(1519)-N(6))-dimethyltransferase RsmA [Thermodesulfobacteriota bacterium]